VSEALVARLLAAGHFRATHPGLEERVNSSRQLWTVTRLSLASLMIAPWRSQYDTLV
jgi:hypothetical protein